jgi:hypothetical protein
LDELRPIENSSPERLKVAPFIGPSIATSIGTVATKVVYHGLLRPAE